MRIKKYKKVDWITMYPFRLLGVTVCLLKLYKKIISVSIIDENEK